MDTDCTLDSCPAYGLGRKALIVYLAFLSAFTPLSTDLFLPALPIMAEYFQATPGLTNLTLMGFMFFFALSTMLGWSYYGEKCFEYLFGEKWVMVYRVAFILVTVLGSLIELKVVWAVSDTLNGLMAIPNLIGLIGLSGVVMKLTRDYFGEKM